MKWPETNLEHIKNWKLDCLMDLLDQFDGLLGEAVNHKLESGKNYKNILLYLGGKAITSFREVICLCGNGFPNGALSIARNIYEQFIILAFFEEKRQASDFDEYVSDYFDDYEIQRNKALKFVAEYVQKDSEKRSQLEVESNKVKDNAHSKSKGDYWWSRKSSFSKLAESIIENQTDESFQSFLSNLHFYYKRACLALHASCMGNELDLGISPDFVGVDLTFKENGHALPLLFAVNCFVVIVGYLGRNFGFEYKDIIHELNDLAIFYQQRLNSNFTNK